MKFYVIYEEVYGYYKGKCISEGVTSFRNFNQKTFNNKKEREEAQEIEENGFIPPVYEYDYFGNIVGQEGGGFYYYPLRLHVEKAIWKYKDISFEEASKNEYFKIFTSEKDAKEYCDILNCAETIFGAESKELKKHYKDYVNKPYYYCKGNKIIEEVPKTKFQIQKLFVKTKGQNVELTDLKDLVIKQVLKWGWEYNDFQLLSEQEIDEYKAKIGGDKNFYANEDLSVANKRKELKEQQEFEEQQKPLFISYIAFKNINGKTVYKFNKKDTNTASKLSSCIVIVKRCGDCGTYGYSEEDKGKPALFIPIAKNVYQYSKTIPGTAKEYNFYEDEAYDLNVFYEVILETYNQENDKKIDENDKAEQENKLSRLEDILQFLQQSAVLNEQLYTNLVRPAYMYEAFPILEEWQKNLLLENSKSKEIIEMRDYLRELLGDPTLD